MRWWEFALLGAGGGIIVEAVELFRWAAAWQQARRGKDGKMRSRPPRLHAYVDLPAHAIMLPARALLGAAGAILFGLTGQITGPGGAVAFGCAAPVLLARLGQIPQVSDVVKGSPKPNEVQSHEASNTAEVPTVEIAATENPVP